MRLRAASEWLAGNVEDGRVARSQQVLGRQAAAELLVEVHDHNVLRVGGSRPASYDHHLHVLRERS